MKVFFHLIDLTLCNAWLLYVLEHNHIYRDEKSLNLYEFKRSVSECWVKQNVAEEDRMLRRQGRPSSQVPNRLKFDKKDHWPHAFSGWDGRVCCVNCKNQTICFT